MNRFFVNLKRFDITKKYGGICLVDDPQDWIKGIIEDTAKSGIGKLEDISLIYILPEGLLLDAINKLKEFPAKDIKTVDIGIQGVFREDTSTGANFGAFSTNVPAAAAKNFGCAWTMNGHSEERNDKFSAFTVFEPTIGSDQALIKKASDAVSTLLNRQNIAALKRGLNVLFCIGETAEEKGSGVFEEQKPIIESILKGQLEIGLKGVKEVLGENELVIGYEPRWAIGPGKVPPGSEYIGFISAFIKGCVKDLYDLEVDVVYGGGLKEENAKMIAGIETIDGGLIALTKFTGDIAFEPEGLKKIIETYLS